MTGVKEVAMRSEAPKAVYTCIAAVSAEIAKEGISKSRRNVQQGYGFRGIDDVYNALAPILAKHGLVILPRILSREVTERTTQKGGVLFYVVVEAEYDFVAASDGSVHIARTYGEAMDSGDKATNKAMSAAYKYVAMQAFCIPTEGDHDSENQTHQVVSDDTLVILPDPPAKPANYDEHLVTYEAEAKKGIRALRDAYKKATPAFREYLTKHDSDRMKRIADTAEAADLADPRNRTLSEVAS